MTAGDPSDRLPAMKILNLLLVSLLVGCAAPTKKQCEDMDWSDLGFKEGNRGNNPQKKLDSYKGYCTEKHGVEVGKVEYYLGYAAGLAKYCLSESKNSELKVSSKCKKKFKSKD